MKKLLLLMIVAASTQVQAHWTDSPAQFLLGNQSLFPHHKTEKNSPASTEFNQPNTTINFEGLSGAKGFTKMDLSQDDGMPSSDFLQKVRLENQKHRFDLDTSSWNPQETQEYFEKQLVTSDFPLRKDQQNLDPHEEAQLASQRLKFEPGERATDFIERRLAFVSKFSDFLQKKAAKQNERPGMTKEMLQSSEAQAKKYSDEHVQSNPDDTDADGLKGYRFARDKEQAKITEQTRLLKECGYIKTTEKKQAPKEIPVSMRRRDYQNKQAQHIADTLPIESNELAHDYCNRQEFARRSAFKQSQDSEKFVQPFMDRAQQPFWIQHLNWHLPKKETVWDRFREAQITPEQKKQWENPSID